MSKNAPKHAKEAFTQSQMLSQTSGDWRRATLNEYSVKQLRMAVREAVKDVNIRYQHMDSQQAEIAFNKLKASGLEVTKASPKTISGIQKQLSRSKVSANVNYKTKQELITQLQGLQKFRAFDYESEEAVTKYDEGWKSFHETITKMDGGKYSSISIEQLKDISNALDTYSDVIDSDSFKYEVFELVETANTMTPEELMENYNQSMTHEEDMFTDVNEFTAFQKQNNPAMYARLTGQKINMVDILSAMDMNGSESEVRNAMYKAAGLIR